MGIESGDLISSLNEAWPLPGDDREFGDDHFRLLKHVLKYAFANTTTSLTINAGTTDFVFNQDGSITINGTPFEGGGTTILNGSGAPSSGLGSPGDYYVDTTNNDLYGPKAGTWSVSIPGFPEVPMDGQLHGRRDAVWEVIPAYAPLANPVFTGNPRGPTPATGDSDTSLATTAFVTGAIADFDVVISTDIDLKAPLANPAFTGNPTAPTPSTGDNDTSVATTAFVKAQAYAPLASPVFTGDPQAPTPLTADNDTSIATTGYVKAQAYLTEAPNDGLQYVRKSLGWSEVVATGGGSLFNYMFNTTTTAPPASGGVRFNNATQASVTTVWMNYTTNDTNPVNLKTFFLARVKVGDSLYFQDKDDPLKWQMYKVTAFTDSSTYATIGVTWTAGGNALTAARIIVSREGAGVANPIGEAPNDGKLYGRQSLNWVDALASPIFTGDPRAPTPTTADNDTSIATTAYVKAQLADTALTGNPTAPTQTAGNSSTRIATTAFVATSFAPLAAPVFTGDARAVTPATSDNDTSIATTAYVQAQGYKKITVASTAPGSPATNDLWVDTT